MNTRWSKNSFSHWSLGLSYDFRIMRKNCFRIFPRASSLKNEEKKGFQRLIVRNKNKRLIFKCYTYYIITYSIKSGTIRNDRNLKFPYITKLPADCQWIDFRFPPNSIIQFCQKKLTISSFFLYWIDLLPKRHLDQIIWIMNYPMEREENLSYVSPACLSANYHYLLNVIFHS